MPQHRKESTPSGHATVAHSHLFPGAVVEADAADDFDLAFADGSRAEAAILCDEAERQVLEVASYRTKAGTTIPERIWMIRSIDGGPNCRRIELGLAMP